MKWINGCPWDEDTCSEAARNGDLEILQYAHENGCPWNKDTYSSAEKNGNIEMLKYLNENSCPTLPIHFINERDKYVLYDKHKYN